MTPNELKTKLAHYLHIPESALFLTNTKRSTPLINIIKKIFIYIVDREKWITQTQIDSKDILEIMNITRKEYDHMRSSISKDIQTGDTLYRLIWDLLFPLTSD